MKKLCIVLAVFAAVSTSAAAQVGPRAQEKIEAFKIGFFTEKLQLTTEESKAFWPLFNQFENDREALKEKYDLDGKKLELLSDKDVESAILQHLDMEDQLVKLRRDYTKRFMEVLPIRKVAMLQRIDTEFKRALLEEIKKRRENRQNGGVGPRN